MCALELHFIRPLAAAEVILHMLLVPLDGGRGHSSQQARVRQRVSVAGLIGTPRGQRTTPYLASTRACVSGSTVPAPFSNEVGLTAVQSKIAYCRTLSRGGRDHA